MGRSVSTSAKRLPRQRKSEIEALSRELAQERERLAASQEAHTATSNVLRLISSSTVDLQTVLETLAATAIRLCSAKIGFVARVDGQVLRYTAGHNVSSELRDFLKRNPIPLERTTINGRAALERRTVHAPDVRTDPNYSYAGIQVDPYRTVLSVPMCKGEQVIGVFCIYRHEVCPFTDSQIALMESFADQAVIAIENARLLTEQRESLERQTAMAEVLGTISSSPGQLQPVFVKMLQLALRLCDAQMGSIARATDGVFSLVAQIGMPGDVNSHPLNNYRPPPHSPLGQMFESKSTIQVTDYRETEAYAQRIPSTVHLVEQSGARSTLQVPLLHNNEVIGAFTIFRSEVRPFEPKVVTLVESFADQAVIAIENARLLTELRESLEQQKAMADVLQAINSSPGNLTPVFDTILEKAHTLCGASCGALFMADGGIFRAAATRGYPDELAARVRAGITRADGRAIGPLLDGARIVHQPDLVATVPPDDAVGLDIIKRGGVRTGLMVPLRKDGQLLGIISSNRAEVRPFADKEIALLESFAAQAVIAIENARLLDEIRQRQAELRVTFDNMGDAVIMFDGEQRLVAWNRNFLHMLDIAEEWLASSRTYGDFATYLRERGEFGDSPPPDIGAPDAGEVRPIRYERTRPNGRVLEVRRNPIPGDAGFVFIYSDITERKLAEQSILAAREAAEHALVDLKLAQANLIQSEKMASLGALTAGIAHEIKNPLNFVNNFANLSNELLGELKDTAAPAFATLDAEKRDEIDETMDMLTGNLKKIQEHGKRADGIVKSMLAHSRGGSGDRREADVNALVEESLNLAYHGARAQDENFNITLERDYDKAMKPIELVPQDVTRVFLNLCGNGFYAANKRRKEGRETEFRPILKVATRDLGDAVEVRIRDNGTGIPPDIKDKLFQPFFTTKPTGEGTGLGLSISYDIVRQQHGGTIAVESAVGDFTEFTIHLPRKR
jgi:two-component system, NtrC family, sensor kinase